MTYEGARSLTGPFLASLGANATIVGLVAGAGELVGYTLRFLSGLLSDKTQQYWLITIIGYVINLFAVPLLALSGHWETAALLMITERIGKAIRTPARDAMLSHATHQMGRGWGFGLHEAMDQIGATLEPLIVSTVFFLKGSFHDSFAILLIPALVNLLVLFTARFFYPHPQELEASIPSPRIQVFPRRYWLYLSAVILIAAGYTDFPLIAYHLEKTKEFPTHWIPSLYALAMGSDAIAALILGKLYDQKGQSIIRWTAGISMFFAPLVFLGGHYGAISGMVLWGIGMGMQESVMRAAIADLIPVNRRGAAYGLFNTGFGLFWFLGSALMGLLYDHSIPAIVVFSVTVQLLAILFLCFIPKNAVKEG